MDNCKICGLQAELKNNKCGFCQREKGIPGANRIKQAISELPSDWFTLNMATNILPYYFSYTVKLLRKMEMIDFIETKGDSPKQFKLTKKAFKYLELKVQPKPEENKVKEKKMDTRMEELLTKIRTKPGIVTKELLILGEHMSTTHNKLNDLIDMGLIEKRKIGNRNAYYPIENEDNNFIEPKTELGSNLAEIPPIIPPSEKEDEIIDQPENGKVEIINENSPSMGQLLDRVWPHCTSAKPRKPTNIKNQEFEALVAHFSDQKTLLNLFNDLPKSLQDNTQITLDPKNKKNQLIIPVISAEA